MKVLWILALFALSVSALPIEEEDRVNGENGWYVPQLDGSFEWVDMQEAKTKMEQLKLIQSRDLSDTPMTFYLYTAANPSQAQIININANSIANSNFNPSNPTRFVIHGWTASVNHPINENIREAWLSRHDCNIIFVDWDQARLAYSIAVSAVPAVGKEVANLINFLVGSFDVSLEDIHLIGHSLGAHIAGYAGKNMNGAVNTIVGLDPARPLFDYNIPEERLSSLDASYVQSIHTDGGGLGFLEPIGEGAFYPNGGKRQPGCTLDITGFCSHIRAQIFYSEAVKYNNFSTIRCNGYSDAVNKSCGNIYSNIVMGSVDNANKVAGVFYAPVNSKSPYSKGTILK